MSRVLCAGAVLAAFIGFAGPTSAASFDCAKAATPTERAICKDPALSILDDKVAQAYAAAMKLWPAGNWAAYIRTEQRGWLKDRNEICKADTACLKQDYNRRLAYLSHPNLKWQGRYVQGECPKDGLYADVTQNYPDTGISVEIYICPDPHGNMLLQATGTPDASGTLVFLDVGCRNVLKFTPDTVSVVSAPAPGGRCFTADSYKGTFRRDPAKSPFLSE